VRAAVYSGAMDMESTPPPDGLPPPDLELHMPGDAAGSGHERQLPIWCGEAGQPKPDSDQDKSVILIEQQVVGLFDGLGGHRDGAAVAQRGADVVDRTYGHARPVAGQQTLADLQAELERCLTTASQEIASEYPSTDKARGGATTAMVVRIVHGVAGPDGEVGSFAVFAGVGNTPAFLIRPSESEEGAQKLAGNEGFGGASTNQLGYDFHGVRRSGVVKLQEGDRLVLATDGAVGTDFATNLSPRRIFDTCVSGTAQGAADALLGISGNTDDDKKIIVIDPMLAIAQQ